MFKFMLVNVFGLITIIFASTIRMINPSGPIVGVFFAIFLLGTVVSFLHYGLSFLSKESIDEIKGEALDESIFSKDKLEDLVDYIDIRASESIIANNNEWLRVNWHRLSNNEKMAWVEERISYLKESLPCSHNLSTPHFITSLQQADKLKDRNQKTKIA